MDNLLIVDGNSILNRAFYGTENSFMKNAEGLYTGAIYGFINILLKYIEEDKPKYIAVAFDVKDPTFRHIEYDQYKGTRKGMPEELASQLPVAKELLCAMNICIIEKPGFEADDIIGTFANRAHIKGVKCTILTGDRDSLQLVNENVSVKLPVTRSGKTNTEYYDINGVEEKYGVEPNQLIDVKALMGDSSDNVPGVPGIGEKTALSLIKEYGSLDNIYDNIDSITKASVKTKLSENKEIAYLSRKLVTICKEVPLEETFEDTLSKEYNTEKLGEILQKLEFRSVIKRLGYSGTENVSKPAVKIKEEEKENINKDIPEMILPEKVIQVSGMEEIEALTIPEICSVMYLYIKYSEKEPSGIKIRFDESVECYSFLLLGSMYNTSFIKKFKQYFENPDIKKVIFDAKPFVLWLKEYNCRFEGLRCDIAIASYLSDSTRKSGNISEVYRFYTSKEIKEGTENELYALSEIESYAFMRLEKDGQMNLYNNIELPLVNILADFEYEGFKVNPSVLHEAGVSYDKRINELTKSIHDMAGKSFNINSPKQLGEVLFDDLKLDGGKKSKTGYKTGIEVLDKLYDVHPIVADIIEYRQNAKLKSTYIDGLLNAINPISGRVHSSFNQMTTATGRLSSTEPNLQNLPIRSEIGRVIRKAFEPRDTNHVLIDADYSQIELRVLAHIAGDETMIDAFKNNADIHAITASKVFNVSPENVTSEQRGRAKAVNFGIIYGISEFGLSRDLNISFSEAKQIISDYLRKYPKIDMYMKDIVEFARANGYVTTLFGRRRYLPELSSTKSQIRSFGERIAMNTPIQGTAADIIKIAMVNVYNELNKRNLKSKLVLQVHDELLIDALKSEADEVLDLLKNCMENAYNLSVPLVVSVSTGENFDIK